MKTPPKYRVGQVVWVEATDRFIRSGERTIERVGREWVYFADNWGRARIADGFTDGGRMFASQAAAEDHKETVVAYRRLAADVYRCWPVPAGVTLADIAEARRLLGLAP